MSGAHKIWHGGIAAFLTILWMATAYAQVKTRDPNTAKTAKPSPQKVSAKQPSPQKVTPARAAEAPKPVPVAKASLVRPQLENPATFTADMPFGRAIEILRNCVYPPINIVVLWRDVEEKAGIDPSTPIGLDGAKGLRIREYLELLLRSVSAGSNSQLGYVIDGGVILVATKDSLPKPKMQTRVYDISDLAAPTSAAGYMGMGMGMGMMPTMSPYGMTSPYGIGNSMQSYGNTGVGMPYGSYNPGVSYPQSSTNNAPRASAGPVVLSGS